MLPFSFICAQAKLTWQCALRSHKIKQFKKDNLTYLSTNLNFSPLTSAGGPELCHMKEYESTFNHTPSFLVAFYWMRKYDNVWKTRRPRTSRTMGHILYGLKIGQLARRRRFWSFRSFHHFSSLSGLSFLLTLCGNFLFTTAWSTFALIQPDIHFHSSGPAIYLVS